MTPPQAPNATSIQRHTGAKGFERGIRYFHGGRVGSRGFATDRVWAAVRGSRGSAYRVDVYLEKAVIEDSDCSCPMESGCKHVAATLLALLADPASFHADLEVQLPSRDRPDTASPEALAAWATERNVADALSRDLAAVLMSVQGYAPRNLPRTVSEFLLQASPRNQWAARLQEEVADWLSELATNRTSAAAYREEAAEWRSIAPDPPLVALWTALRTRLDELSDTPWAHGLTRCPDLTGATVHEDPPALRLDFWPATGRRRVDVPLQPVSLDDLQVPEALAATLDLLTHPDLADTPLRATVLREIQIVPWERTVAALDRAVNAVAAEVDTEGREMGWRIRRHHGDWELTPVWCRPYKNKQGLRTWKLTLDKAPLPRPADRAAAAILEADRGYRYRYESLTGSVLRAVAELVGHPWVILDKGLHITVRQASLTMHWEPTEDGGVEIVTRLDGRELSREEVAAISTDASSDVSWLVDPAGRRINVISCPPAALAMLGVLAKRGSSFPAQARGPLLERFDRLTEHVPITLGGALRGAEVQGDTRPLVRLMPAPDGSLDLEILSRVLAGARPWPPGGGPEVVAALRDSERVFVRRSLRAEEDAVRDFADELGLAEQQGFRWNLEDPEEALSAIVLLREAGEDLQLEWQRPAPRISEEATAEELRIEATKRRDWFGINGSLEVPFGKLSLAELLAAVRNKRRFVQVADGAWIRLAQGLVNQLEAAAAVTWAGRTGLELPLMATTVLDEVKEAGAEVDLPESWEHRTAAIAAANQLDVPIPEGLDAELRPYQIVGFQWLVRTTHWSPGAVLADDMGLGKTIQALALLLTRAEHGPALVVAPASVGINWIREANRFAPSLSVASYRGPKRLQMLDKLREGDVIVTSWELMARDIEHLREVDFSTVVLDEAQAIKNAGTARAQASSKLEACFVLALTGTPVENRVAELWSLFRTVVPGLFGSSDRFRHQFGGTLRRPALSRLVRPFLLRRLKEEVARDLPPITEVDVRIELSPDERERYEDFRQAAIEEIENSRGQKDGATRFRLLAAMTRLRQLACDLRLVHKDQFVATGTKVERLREIIASLRETGHRALVFSQFTTLLGLARDALEADGVEVRYLDGSTPLKRRQAEVDAFQAGEGDAFLISLKAGGTGLNLTAASYVIHLDPWWNPATEDQATDRAHRIGQDKPVTVYRLVATDTIEDVVLALHADKRAMVDELLDGTGKGAALSTSEMMSLLTANQ